MPTPICHARHLIGGFPLVLLLSAPALLAQERVPVAPPSWRLMIDAGRAWGVGGGTPDGRGTTASLAGRRRLSRNSPVAFDVGLLFGGYNRPPSTREPINPYGDAARDTTRNLALVGPFASMSVDLLAPRRTSIFTEAGVYYGAVRERTRFDRTTTIDRQIGERVGLLGGVGVRLPNGFGLKARYLWVSVPDRPISVAEFVTSFTMF